MGGYRLIAPGGPDACMDAFDDTNEFCLKVLVDSSLFAFDGFALLGG